jgi:hypothetical protein
MVVPGDLVEAIDVFIVPGLKFPNVGLYQIGSRESREGLADTTKV